MGRLKMGRQNVIRSTMGRRKDSLCYWIFVLAVLISLTGLLSTFRNSTISWHPNRTTRNCSEKQQPPHIQENSISGSRLLKPCTVENYMSTSEILLKDWASEKLREQFKPSITQEEKSQLMYALEVLIDALDSAGIQYYAFGGTLIGSWRHHDMVPWDDDIDIVVNASDRQAVAQLKFPNHTMSTIDSFRYRLMQNNGRPARGGRSFKWPFIDIVFFGDSGSYVYNTWKPMSKTHVFKKSDIFPLYQRPFGKLTIYSPHNPLVIIKDAANICKTREWSHRDIVPLPQIFTEDCKLLFGIYPFVIRDDSSSDYDTEKLYLNGKLLHSIKFKKP